MRGYILTAWLTRHILQDRLLLTACFDQLAYNPIKKLEIDGTRTREAIRLAVSIIFAVAVFVWWDVQELNLRHENFQSSALPTELTSHVKIWNVKPTFHVSDATGFYNQSKGVNIQDGFYTILTSELRSQKRERQDSNLGLWRGMQ